MSTNIQSSVSVDFVPTKVVGGFTPSAEGVETLSATVTFSATVRVRVGMAGWSTLYQGKNVTGSLVSDPGGGWHLMGVEYHTDRAVDFFIYQAVGEAVYRQREALRRMVAAK